MRLFLVLVCAISAIPFIQCKQEGQDLEEDANESNPRTCADEDVTNWASAFDACFTKKKLTEGDWDLQDAMDRIPEQVEECVNKDKLPCRPNHKDFKKITNKVIDQLQDYSESFRLQMDPHGKETKKHVDCVGNVLSSQSYAKCFETVFGSSSPKNYGRNVKKAISCANDLNKLCSKEAKASLNRMATVILGMKQPDIFESTPHSSPPPLSTSPPPSSSSPLPSSTSLHDQTPLPTVPPPPPPPPPPPTPSKKWYEYVSDFFVKAWDWVKSIFGF